MNTNGSTIRLLLSAVLFITVGILHTNAQCDGSLTPNSEILSESGQALVASWLSEEFQFEAELVFDSHTATVDMSEFHDACDGLSNTLVVAISEEGNICGGFNEGTWSSVQETISGLDNNFLFSVSNEEVYPAIPGAQHISNNDFSGPYFGGGSSADMRIAQLGTEPGFLVNQLGTNYECPETNIIDCEAYFNNGMNDGPFNDRFYITRWEVWQLNTTGTVLPQDSDNDGVCDADEVVGCQNPNANNYNELATDAGECEFDPCPAALTPGSELLTETDQGLLLSWLPSGFEYEAELVMDSDVSGFTGQAFHSVCDGLSNTVLVARTLEGNIIGGYNEGVWSSDNQEQFDLDNNFLFSITGQEKFNAIPGMPHIHNASFPGPRFGGSTNADYRSFSDNGNQLIVENVLGTSYECPAANTSDCDVYMNDGVSNFGVNDRFTINKFEIWQLKTSGPTAYLDGTSGGCTDIEAVNYNPLAACSNSNCVYAGCTLSADPNYDPSATLDDGTCLNYSSCPGDFNGDFSVTVGDLSGFLAAFGTTCSYSD